MLVPRIARASVAALVAASLASCESDAPDATRGALEDLVAQYAVFRLEADLSGLDENDRDIETALALAGEDAAARRFIEINYGPWDRLRGDRPLIDGVGKKPLGANFYPADITQEDFEGAARGNEELRSPYTLVRRADDGSLEAVPYREVFADAHRIAAAKLREAAELGHDPLAEDPGHDLPVGLLGDVPGEPATPGPLLPARWMSHEERQPRFSDRSLQHGR